ncbi:hypothetical protein PHLCEN_2v3470 [Hermanssonia centrifuga]|uniref:Cytochrome P450 n=1 Tax=Hermanssonia centrifuga TaxID=98765 RepID=A0A2R6QIN8_9APHY|nr:hypothetical protein PHLCEN_2v3470 [Hermanssonia centrifuga]
MTATTTAIISTTDYAIHHFSESLSLPSFSTARGFVFAISVYASYVFAILVYRLFFSPLASLPGPWYAAVSDFWITTHVVRMQQCRTVQTLFERYGPVVRIGPNKVAFCDVTTMRSVYSVHKFDKSTYYKSLLTMTTLPHAQHAIRRKSYAPHYTPSNLALFQPELQDFSLKLTDALERIAAQTSVDCLDLFRHLMVDVIACTVFGIRTASLDNWSLNIRDPLSVAVYNFPKRGILVRHN